MVQKHNAYDHILAFLETIAPSAISYPRFQTAYLPVNYTLLPCMLSIEIML